MRHRCPERLKLIGRSRVDVDKPAGRVRRHRGSGRRLFCGGLRKGCGEDTEQRASGQSQNCRSKTTKSHGFLLISCSIQMRKDRECTPVPTFAAKPCYPLELVSRKKKYAAGVRLPSGQEKPPRTGRCFNLSVRCLQERVESQLAPYQSRRTFVTSTIRMYGADPCGDPPFQRASQGRRYGVLARSRGAPECASYRAARPWAERSTPDA